MDGEGFVDLDKLQSSITPETVLVSIQHANQEIGTLQDIKAIADICHDKGVLYHADATHTFRRVPLDVSKVPVDLLTISAHTIHGPKGVGGLFIRKGTQISKWMDGGFQESNRRAGLENIPGIIGFAKAADLWSPKRRTSTSAGLRDSLIKRMLETVPQTILNGSPTKRTPQNANITFHLRRRGIDHPAPGHERVRGQHRFCLFQPDAGGQPRHHGRSAATTSGPMARSGSP